MNCLFNCSYLCFWDEQIFLQCFEHYFYRNIQDSINNKSQRREIIFFFVFWFVLFFFFSFYIEEFATHALSLIWSNVKTLIVGNIWIHLHFSFQRVVVLFRNLVNFPHKYISRFCTKYKMGFVYLNVYQISKFSLNVYFSSQFINKVL